MAIAFSILFDWTLDTVAAVLSGMVAWGGSGVAGWETSGIGMRLERLSCDNCGSMVARKMAVSSHTSCDHNATAMC